MQKTYNFVFFLYCSFIFVLVMNSTVFANDDRKQIITLGFDGLADLSLDVDDFGVTFTGAQVLACNGSLNCPFFPPFSGSNVIFDQPDSGGLITATFDAQVTGVVDKVSARVTGNRNVTMTAFGTEKEFLGSAQTGGANFVGSDTGLSPNILLEITSDLVPIDSVTFQNGGNTYTVDNFSFQAELRTVVIDPGHGSIITNGVPSFQRPPSPTFGLIEDQLVLVISKSAKASLEKRNVRVFLTRETDAAPFAPPDCGVPCPADINERVRWAEKQEPDLLISVHTNGSDTLTANGAESFYSVSAASPSSQQLSQFVLSQVVSLGLRNRGVKLNNFNIIASPNMTSSLIEVAFHSNSELADGQDVTDEQKLSTPTFLNSAGAAIADGIGDYYEKE